MTTAPTSLQKVYTPAALAISVTYTSIDRCRKTAKFKTLKGAQAFAVRHIGATPELGSFYAVSADGIGKIECRGVPVRSLFPALADDVSAAGEPAAGERHEGDYFHGDGWL